MTPAKATLLAAFFCAACGRGAGAESEPYYPAVAGTRWEYTATYGTPDHPEIPPRKGRRIDRLEVGESGEGQGNLSFSSTLEGIGTEPVTGKSFLRADASGVYFRVEPTADETLGLPLPVEVGRTWSSSDSSGEWQGRVLRELPIGTPAGNFESCVEVSLRQTVDTSDSRGQVDQVTTYCRGVGPVKRVTTTESPGPEGPIRGVMEETLVLFTRGGAAR